MTVFIAMNPKTEVNGETVYSLVAGMGAFKAKALEILERKGISNPRPSMWYSQQKWLDAFKEISETIGSSTLFMIGLAIPENAQFPPQIHSIDEALLAIDVAYHMNHRIDGRVLFDQATGRMSEGIGHYSFSKVRENAGRMICNNPYPCTFDRGIIEGTARRFKPAGGHMVVVRHDDAVGCRMRGGLTCEYEIKW